MAHHDLVISGGTIIDGTGAPGYVGDIGIDGGLISAVIAAAGALAIVLWAYYKHQNLGQTTRRRADLRRSRRRSKHR